MTNKELISYNLTGKFKHMLEEYFEQIEDVKGELCHHYCKYPNMQIPEGRDEDWLFDDDAPCANCPLDRL